jgi:predicted peptidase
LSYPLPRLRHGFWLLVALLFLGLPPGVYAQTVDDFQDRTYSDGTDSIPYRLFVPADYDPNQSYPLVLFLHGSGERGTDNRLQLTGQTAPLVFVRPENQAQWPCFMMAPQCPLNDSWFSAPFNHDGPPTTAMRLALEALVALFDEFSIDPAHLYITGLSMGGFGTWDTITRYPGLFAAAVPIASYWDPAQADLCVPTPIWAFHGDADTVVSVEYDRAMIAAIIDAGGDPLYTEYHGAGHVESWNRAYAEPDLLPWLFGN